MGKQGNCLQCSLAIIAYIVYASGERQKVRSLMIRSMIGIVRFPVFFAPLSHVCRYVTRVILVPFARSGIYFCFIAPFGWLSWLRSIGLCMPCSTTRLAVGCQSIRAMFILAELSKVGFSAGGAFLHFHDNIFNTYTEQTQ